MEGPDVRRACSRDFQQNDKNLVKLRSEATIGRRRRRASARRQRTVQRSPDLNTRASIPRSVAPQAGCRGNRSRVLRNTVNKWLREPHGSEPKVQRVEQRNKLALFEAQLCQALKVDKLRRKRERRTTLQLLMGLRGAGYSGGYSQSA